MASATQYAKTARAYWETYRPTETAAMSDPDGFFRSLGQQVKEQVSGTADQMPSSLPANPTSQDLVAARQGAMRAAEEIAMVDLVFLPPEPGTEERRLVGSGPLLGWEDDAEPPLRATAR